MASRATPHFPYLTGGPLPLLKAMELEDGVRHGHEVAVIAEPGEESISLLGRPLAKMCRVLAQTDGVDDPGLTVGLRMTSIEIRGVLSCDPE